MAEAVIVPSAVGRRRRQSPGRRSSKNDGFSLLVVLHDVKGATQFTEQFVRHRVQLLWRIQRQSVDAVFFSVISDKFMVYASVLEMQQSTRSVALPLSSNWSTALRSRAKRAGESGTCHSSDTPFMIETVPSQS